MKNIIVLVILAHGSMAYAECSWTDPDCFSDDIDEVTEGTFIGELVKPITNEIRQLNDTDGEKSSSEPSDSDDNNYDESQ